MNNMDGFMGKKRGGGSGFTSGYSNNCGHPNGSQDKTVSPQPKKILTGKVKDSQEPATKPAELNN